MQSPFRPDIAKGKVILITGGGTGIGFGIATEFGKHGAKVAIMGRRKEKLDEAVKVLESQGIDALGVTGDVRYPDKVQAVVDAVIAKYGRLDILVNNAAGNFMVAAKDLTNGGFKTVQEIDLQGCFNMCKACYEPLKATKNGLILNITATLHYRANPFQMHAAAAKAGIDVVTNVLGVEWAEDDIRVVGIAPGPIAKTEGGPTGRVFGGAGYKDEMSRKKIQKLVPAGRYGEVEDVAFTALFVSTDAGSWITAETIVVDGGHHHGTGGTYQMMKKMIKPTKKEERESRTPDAKL
jgi:peroxisomal 2,4-dienoyl-CoA reductase